MCQFVKDKYEELIKGKGGMRRRVREYFQYFLNFRVCRIAEMSCLERKGVWSERKSDVGGVGEEKEEKGKWEIC